MRNKDWLTCLLLPLLIFSSSMKLVAEEDKKAKLRQLTKDLPIFGFSWHPSGKEILFNSRDWIYSVDVNEGQIKKLIPGCCLQWIEDGKRFIYFLKVGYDGNRCELWSADRNGEARWRLCDKDFFILTKPFPIVAPNGKMIAFHYERGSPSRRFYEIRLLVLGDSLEAEPSVRILFVVSLPTFLHIIGWLDNNHLVIVCDGQVLALDVHQVEWAPVDSNFMSERFLRLKRSSVGVTETSYQELIRTRKIPYNCEVSQDGRWLAQVKHEGGQPYKNKLIVRKLVGEEKSIMICEDVSPPCFYGLPRFAPAGLKMAFIKWSGDPRYYSGDLWMADLSEIESQNSEYAGKDNGQEN